MRFVLYNIRYGTGFKRSRMPWIDYLRRTGGNLDALAGFIETLEPDIVGLLEVDAGSYRSSGRSQSQTIADRMGHYHSYEHKYGREATARRLPLLKQQGNAFVVRDRIRHERFHFFNRGVKKLVIELELEHLDVFLVHLAILFGTRHAQLRELAELIHTRSRPRIVAGDFNPLRGHRELDWFLEATGLVNAAPMPVATFPSWAPHRPLDYILHTPDIRVHRLWAPRVGFSDHLPLVCDFSAPTPE